MSAQGTILVLDGVSTNRIMLKVQLTAAWYHVAQGEKLSGLRTQLRRVQPDLVLTALTLPDCTAADVKKLMQSDPAFRDVPVVAIAAHNDKAARLRALSEGLDDVLGFPVSDTFLLARVRSLLRARSEAQDLQGKKGIQPFGFAEASAPVLAPARMGRIAVLAQSARQGTVWREALAERTGKTVESHTLPNPSGVLSGTAPDAIVVELSPDPQGLNMLADLKSRIGARRTAVIGIIPDENTTLAADALDRGADAVCLGGFCATELALRIDALMARRAHEDHMRAALWRGLEESLIDPLTGLNNRRYALSALDRMMTRATRKGQSFAIMLADLDHFKSINDRYGHSVGDQVLVEAAKRMRRAFGNEGFLARIGGEEFLFALPDADHRTARAKAERICQLMAASPFVMPTIPTRLTVTVSVGLKLCEPPFQCLGEDGCTAPELVNCADRALYAAKKAGRNQFRLSAA